LCIFAKGGAVDLVKFLKIMEMEERAAFAKYQWALEQTDNPDLKAIFARLRDEESVHADYLLYEREKLEKLLDNE
jgi:rubrerythrin